MGQIRQIGSAIADLSSVTPSARQRLDSGRRLNPKATAIRRGLLTGLAVGICTTLVPSAAPAEPVFTASVQEHISDGARHTFRKLGKKRLISVDRYQEVECYVGGPVRRARMKVTWYDAFSRASRETTWPMERINNQWVKIDFYPVNPPSEAYEPRYVEASNTCLRRMKKRLPSQFGNVEAL